MNRKQAGRISDYAKGIIERAEELNGKHDLVRK